MHQSILNRTFTHLYNQAHQSMTEDGEICAYRGHSGLMCAVGVLIDDEHYSPDLEGHSVTNSAVREAVQQSNPGLPMDDRMIGLLSDIQSAHDNIDDPSPTRYRRALTHRFSDIANDYNLEAPHGT